MAYNQYSGYGGNPYGQEEARAGYGASNPYGSAADAGGYSASNPYAGQGAYGAAVGFSASSRFQFVDYLAKVEAAKGDINKLTSNISQIASAHQRTLSSPDASSSAQLENLVTQTQVLNTRIKDQIRALKADAARSGTDVTKDAQLRNLEQTFKKQLLDYQAEETTYRTRYQEQIARQYRIVNPEATEEEVREAANADWGDEGVFQTALKTNRSATASSVLGAVRARHNDIQQIERTLIELNQLFQDLAEAVLVQDVPIQQAEETTANVQKDTEAGNVQLDKGIVHARRARKLKWWCLFIVVLIVCILALVLGLYFGLTKR
ncbi:t-SNARE [Cryomyces antarcticus]